jgi:hypothetical protein
MWKTSTVFLVVFMLYFAATEFSDEDTATLVGPIIKNLGSREAESDIVTAIHTADDFALEAKTPNGDGVTCNSLLISIQENENTYQEMLKEFDHTANGDFGSNKVSKELIIQDAGINLDSYRRLTSLFDIELNTLITVDGKPKKSAKYASLLAKMINHQDYLGLIELVESQHITNNSHFLDKSVLSAIIIGNNHIASTEFSLLMGSGLTPSFADFVTMTTVHFSVENIEMALAHVKNNQVIYNKWHQANYEHNLTLVAAKSFNLAAFELWYQLGVPADLENDNYTAMDLIASPKNHMQRQQATKIFTVLAKDNIYPYSLSSLDKIGEWLPEATKKMFREYFVRSRPVLNDWQQTQSNHLAKKFQKINVKLSELKQRIAICESHSPNNRHEINDANVNNPAIFDINSVEALLAYFKAKEAEDNHVNEQFMATLADDENLDTTKAFPELTAEESVNIRLILALKQNKPYQFLLSLLHKGATLPDAAIFLLTVNSNVKLIKQLKYHELNIYAIDPSGNTALHYALRSGSTNETFDYLIKEGIDIMQGADLLHESIQALNIRGNTPYFIKQLVLNGTNLNQAHSDAFKKIVPLDKVKYEKVEKYITEQLNQFR